MLEKSARIAALFVLWSANILLLASIWTGTALLGLIGAALGTVIGLPAAYLWLAADDRARQQFNRHIRPILEQVAYPRGKPKRVPVSSAPAAAPVETVETVETTEASLHVDVEINGEDDPPETFETVVPQEKATPNGDDSAVQPVNVRVEPTAAEIAAQEAARREAEWEQKKAADREYERIRDLLHAEAEYEALVSYLDHTDARVRLVVVQRLRHLEDERTLAHFQAALDDEDATVQRAARLALEERDSQTEDQAEDIDSAQ